MLLTPIIFLTCVFYSTAEHNDIHTIQYTTETFSVEVPKRNHFVMFFAPWCGHCNRLAPTWEQLAEAFNNDVDSEVTIAKVDCTTDTSLCSDQDVTGYPTLKFFKAGETESVKFRGTRDMASLTVFINEQLGKVQQDSKSEPSVPEPVNGLVELTEETFTKHVASGKHFIKFYAPWCGHCQKLAPTWDSLAKSFEHDTTVTIGKVDCTVHRSICNNFDIKGYPTLLWIEDGKKVEKYQGQRTHEELKVFIVQMLGSSDAETMEKMPEENTSPVIAFSGDNFDHGVSKGVSFIKFFAPWCGHCKRLAPTWDELGKKFLGNPNVKIVKVDCTLDTSKDLCNQQEVDGFPTLFLYKEGKKIAEYTGTRSLDDMYDFVMKHTQHDEL